MFLWLALVPWSMLLLGCNSNCNFVYTSPDFDPARFCIVSLNNLSDHNYLELATLSKLSQSTACYNISSIAKTYGMALHPITNEMYFVGSFKYQWPRYLYKILGNISAFDSNSSLEYKQITGFDSDSIASYTSGITFAQNNSNGAPILFGINGHGSSMFQAHIFTISLDNTTANGKIGAINEITSIGTASWFGRNIVYSPYNGYLYTLRGAPHGYLKYSTELVIINPNTRKIASIKLNPNSPYWYDYQALTVYNETHLLIQGSSESLHFIDLYQDKDSLDVRYIMDFNTDVNGISFWDNKGLICICNDIYHYNYLNTNVTVSPIDYTFYNYSFYTNTHYSMTKEPYFNENFNDENCEMAYTLPEKNGAHLCRLWMNDLSTDCINITGIVQTYGMALHPITNEIYFVGSPTLNWPRYLYKIDGDISNYNFFDSSGGIHNQSKMNGLKYTQITGFSATSIASYIAGITFAEAVGSNDNDVTLFGISGYSTSPSVTYIFTIDLDSNKSSTINYNSGNTTMSEIKEFVSVAIDTNFSYAGRNIAYSPFDRNLYMINDNNKLLIINPKSGDIQIEDMTGYTLYNYLAIAVYSERYILVTQDGDYLYVIDRNNDNFVSFVAILDHDLYHGDNKAFICSDLYNILNSTTGDRTTVNNVIVVIGIVGFVVLATVIICGGLLIKKRYSNHNKNATPHCQKFEQVSQNEVS